MTKETKKEEETKVDPSVEAVKVLQAEEQKKLQECQLEIQTALQKYGYSLDIQQGVVLKKVK